MKHIITLLSGTVIAQIIGMALSIPLLRIYTPEDYGLFTIFQSMVAVAASVAALRYDLAIMLPRRDVAAKVLRRLASWSILIVSFLLSLGCIMASKWIEHASGSSLLTRWLMVSGLVVFLTAEVANIQFWLNRKSDYRGIAINRVVQTAGVSAFQLVASLFVRGLSGLVMGVIAGQLLALLLLIRHTPELRETLPEDAPTKREMAVRYKKMPLLNGPNVLIDAIRNNGINLLIARVAVSGLGQFSQAQKMIQVPVGLIQGAISQVFFQKMATVEPGQMLNLVTYTLKRMALAGIPVFALVYLLSPWAFTFLFGPEWAEAGQFARALTPWLFFTMMTSPISNIFVTTETQQYLLIFAVFYCVFPLALLAWSPWDLLTTVWALSWLMTVMLAIMLVMALAVARRFDTHPEQGDDR